MSPRLRAPYSPCFFTKLSNYILISRIAGQPALRKTRQSFEDMVIIKKIAGKVVGPSYAQSFKTLHPPPRMRSTPPGGRGGRKKGAQKRERNRMASFPFEFLNSVRFSYSLALPGNEGHHSVLVLALKISGRSWHGAWSELNRIDAIGDDGHPAFATRFVCGYRTTRNPRCNPRT